MMVQSRDQNVVESDKSCKHVPKMLERLHKNDTTKVHIHQIQSGMCHAPFEGFPQFKSARVQSKSMFKDVNKWVKKVKAALPNSTLRKMI